VSGNGEISSRSHFVGIDPRGYYYAEYNKCRTRQRAVDRDTRDPIVFSSAAFLHLKT